MEDHLVVFHSICQVRDDEGACHELQSIFGESLESIRSSV